MNEVGGSFARLLPLVVLTAVGLTGCATATKEGGATLAMPASWLSAAVTEGHAAAKLTPWQDFVRDAGLRALVDQALANNRDTRVALLQMEQARAQFEARRAARFPTVAAGLTGSRRTESESGPISSTYTGGLLVSEWEIDFFGRLGSLSEAARAQYLASAEMKQASELALVSAVSSGWLSLRASDALLSLTEKTLAARESSLRLVRLRYDHGTASALELRQAESLAAAARVAQAQQQRQRALDLNALALLVGQPLTEQLVVTGGSDTPSPLMALDDSLSQVGVGLPSAVLLERPDVRAAEWQLRAAQAQIEAARAAFFPRVLLTASVGSASSELAGLFKGGAWGWALAPQAFLTIFDAGARRAGLDAANSAQGIALAQYDKAIQVAFKEVNDALAGQTTLQAQVQAQEDLVRAEEQRLKLSEMRYEQGLSSQLELLDAQRSVFAAQQQALQMRLALAQNRVALFKALGGSWRQPS